MSTATRLAPVNNLRVQTASFAEEIRAGLSKAGQKELPSKYLYDEVGSALFEVICALPEYGLSRAGARLLERHSEELAFMLPKPVTVAELGSGSGQKTKWILEALARRQKVKYYPIDISPTALNRCEIELGRIEFVTIVGFERFYLDGLAEVAARREPNEHLLVLFLGSTIGNFDRPCADQFLSQIREVLHPDDALLLATDLEKPVPQILLAYDDPIGVTAAFDLNLLARMNRELGANFDLSRFAHLARYDEKERRVEMHLRSLASQDVHIPAADLSVHFHAGETIWTESSHKFSAGEVVQMARRSGFTCAGQWTDAEWPFAQSLLIAA